MNEGRQQLDDHVQQIESYVSKCQQEAILQLEKLKQEMKENIENITQQKENLDSRLKKITSGNQTIKINIKEKASFEKDCDVYIQSLENLILEIDSRITGWNNILYSKNTEQKEKIFSLSLFTHHNMFHTKKFIKKVKKNIVVIHSRFSFRFELQQKHIKSFEHLM